MKRAAVIAIASIAVGAVVIGGSALAWSMTRPPSLEDAAGRYLSALSSGDYGAIADLRGPGSDPAADDLLEAAFTGAAEYVSDVQDVTLDTDEDKGDADDAKVGSASVELGGARHTVSFGFTLEGGRWLLDDSSLATARITTSIGDSVHIGDALVPVSASVSLLPAAYPVTAAPDGLLDGRTTVLVTTQEPAEATLSTQVRPAASDGAQSQLDAYADTCAQASSTVPMNCGIRVPWAADLVSLERVTFRIDEYPVVGISNDGRTFAATGGVIVATATGTSRAGGTAAFTYRADDWALRGTVGFTADEMIIAVR